VDLAGLKPDPYDHYDPSKPVSDMSYNVLIWALDTAQSINHCNREQNKQQERNSSVAEKSRHTLLCNHRVCGRD